MARVKFELDQQYDTSETTTRCDDDMRLRLHEFRIKHRPQGRPAIWERRNDTGQWVEYSEELAHRYADAQEKAVAEV